MEPARIGTCIYTHIQGAGEGNKEMYCIFVFFFLLFHVKIFLSYRKDGILNEYLITRFLCSSLVVKCAEILAWS